jgi:AcrR family transcriptional regulator
MADVAEALGVAKGTLYLCVESKEALFDAVLRYADGRDRSHFPVLFRSLPPRRDARCTMCGSASRCSRLARL